MDLLILIFELVRANGEMGEHAAITEHLELLPDFRSDIAV